MFKVNKLQKLDLDLKRAEEIHDIYCENCEKKVVCAKMMFGGDLKTFRERNIKDWFGRIQKGLGQVHCGFTRKVIQL